MSKTTESAESKGFPYRKRKRELVAIFVAVLAYVSYNLFIKSPQSPIIETTNGKLIGTVASSRIGREYYEFKGIPYASKPDRFEVVPLLINMT